MAQISKLAMAIKLIYLIFVITLSFDMTEGLGFDQPFIKNYGHFGRSTPKPKNFYIKWRQMLVIIYIDYSYKIYCFMY